MSVDIIFYGDEAQSNASINGGINYSIDQEPFQSGRLWIATCRCNGVYIRFDLVHSSHHEFWLFDSALDAIAMINYWLDCDIHPTIY